MVANTGRAAGASDGRSGFRDKLGQWGETLRANKVPVLLFLGMGLVLGVVIRAGSEDRIDTWYGYLFDPVVGVGTFIVAVAVWLRTAKARWEDALPKALNVRFTVDSEVFLEVTSLPLVGPADIRNFAQQAIKSWNGNTNAALGLNFTVHPGIPVKRPDGRWVQVWACDYPLLDKPGSSCTEEEHGGGPHVWVIDPLSTDRAELCTKGSAA